MGKPIVVTDEKFQAEVIDSDIPVLVDFWAPWCGPCRVVAPVVEQIADDYAGKLKVAKMDVDDNPVIPSRYAVASIPTLMIFKSGQVADRVVGAVPKQMLASALDKVLSR